MATASVPKPGRPSESGALAPGRSMTGHKVTPVPIPKPGSIPSLPPSANNAAAGAGAANNTATTASTTPTTSQAGFGLLNPSEANLQDAATGAHRDGRIRNPVPSKLKGKTDGSKGNFSVLHMEVAGRTEATERDAQAKRTSESTALAAKRAFENGYVSHRRSRFVHVPDETTETPPPKPFIPSVVTQPAPVPGTASTSGQPEPVFTRRSPLNSEETKSEQARLLTLLRSLHPLLVVDQICKALAFFGGIPGAPPPPDGSFPESAEANGPGSLFVGWIAEIFPKLGGNGSQPARSPGRQLDSTETLKRRRGRPKGSKATKARKDKGIKKGPIKPSTGSDQSRPPPAVDESWVDIDEGEEEEDEEDDRADPPDNVDANVMLLAQASGAQPNSQPSTQQEAQQRAMGVESTPVRTALPGNSGNGNPNDGTPSTKKRGRPKGSKNRPKDASLVSSEVPSTVSKVTQEAQDVQPSYMASGQVSQPTQQTQIPAANSSFTAVNSAATTTTPLKKKIGRPKGSTGKQKPKDPSGVVTSGLLPDAGPSTQASSISVPEGNNHTNHGQAYPTSQQAPTNLQAPVMAGQAQQAPGNSAQKRKRKPTRESNIPLPDVNGEAGAQASSEGQANGVMTLPIAKSMDQSPQLGGSAALSLPPAKRPRKGQEPKSSTKKPGEPPPATETRQPNPGAANMISPAPAPAPAPAPKPSPTPMPAASSAQVRGPTPVPTPGLSAVQISTSIPVEPTMTSDSSPQHSHFEVQSPTIENYEAQLQAQLEQQTEAESQSQPLASQGQVNNNSRHLMANRLQSHHQHHHLQQRQQQMQQAQQVQHVQQAKQQAQQPSVSHSLSPNPQTQSQPQTKKPQTESPIIGQQQARQYSHSQQQYSQYRTANAQYSQQHHQPDQQEHKQHQQPPQQNYSSPQPAQQHFAAHSQNTPSVTGQSQQYAAASQQSQQQHQQQYTPGQQSYTPGQHQYSGGQQHVGSHPRYQQQLGTSSGGTASYTSHQSPQFGTSTASNTGFNAVDSNYRAASSTLNNPSYVPQRSQSATPSATAAYRATNAHNLSHHSSFGANTGAGQHRSASTSHAVGQNVQGMTHVGSFTPNTATDWGNLFDTSNLDGAGTQGALGLNNTSYNMNPASVRSQQNTGATFSASSLTNFDTSGLGASDRYYGVQRR
ncbi:hypothetical protein V8F20_009637 [Naviculisporaceae sp. PSN 640]